MDNYTVQHIKFSLRYIRNYIPNISDYYKKIKIGCSKDIRDSNKKLFIEICKLPQMNKKCSYHLTNVFCNKTDEYYPSHYDNDFNIIEYHVNYLIDFLRDNPNSKLSYDKIVKKSVKEYWDGFLPNFHNNANTILSFLNR